MAKYLLQNIIHHIKRINMEKSQNKFSPFALVMFFVQGLIFGVLLAPYVYPKQVTTVTYEKQNGTLSYESNRQWTGDEFFVVFDKDTVLSGISYANEWK